MVGGDSGGGSSSGGRSVKHEETRGKFRTTRFLPIFFSHFLFLLKIGFVLNRRFFQHLRLPKGMFLLQSWPAPNPGNSHEFMASLFKSGDMEISSNGRRDFVEPTEKKRFQIVFSRHVGTPHVTKSVHLSVVSLLFGQLGATGFFRVVSLFVVVVIFCVVLLFFCFRF